MIHGLVSDLGYQPMNIYEPGEKVTVGIHPVDVMSYDAAPDAR